MKTCTHTNCSYPVFGKGFCKNHQRLRTDKKPLEKKPRKPIAKMSKKLSGDRVTYRKLRIEFLNRPENMFCAVFPHLRATEIHHPKGRGKCLNVVEKWIAVSREGHEWIHANVALATERGFMESRLKLTDKLNDQDKINFSP